VGLDGDSCAASEPMKSTIRQRCPVVSRPSYSGIPAFALVDDLEQFVVGEALEQIAAVFFRPEASWFTMRAAYRPVIRTLGGNVRQPSRESAMVQDPN
jgi:hypothetical protein